MGDQEEEEERKHFAAVVRSFDAYLDHSCRRLDREAAQLARLPPATRAVLDLERKAAALREAVRANAGVLAAIAEPHQVFEDDGGPGGPGMHSRELAARTAGSQGPGPPPAESDMDKVRSTLKQLARDWSEEGAEERAQCYEPLLADLRRLYPDARARGALQVLIPGAGLGRLAWEVARLGFNAQGNEFSYHMLLASNFVLNRCADVGPMRVHPYVHQTINVRTFSDRVRALEVPDVHPGALPEGVAFSMAAGDFEEVYQGQAGAWDCVATCFFLDTAHDVSRYLALIWALLRPGGVWLNLGPLLYHFAEVAGEHSVELPWEDVKRLARAQGLHLEGEAWRRCRYAGNSRGMMHTEYDCVHTVWRKPEQAQAPGSDGAAA